VTSANRVTRHMQAGAGEAGSIEEEGKDERPCQWRAKVRFFIIFLLNLRRGKYQVAWSHTLGLLSEGSRYAMDVYGSTSLFVNFIFKWHRLAVEVGLEDSLIGRTLFSAWRHRPIGITIIASSPFFCFTSVRKALTSFTPKFRIQPLLLSGSITSGRINQVPLSHKSYAWAAHLKKSFYVILHSPRSKTASWPE